MRKYAKAVAILIMFLFLLASVVPMVNGNMRLDDPTVPVTSIFYNDDTGIVTLIAIDYDGEVIATYYKIDGGPQIEYTEPFKLPEGTHTVEYWSVDNNGGWEMHKTATFTFDTTPPTVLITSPEEGGIYFLGNKILNLGEKAICIGEAPILVSANDGDGLGVDTVFFNIKNDTGYDSTVPYGYTYKGSHFGELTITATAVDKKGLMSEPDKITVFVFSLGIL